MPEKVKSLVVRMEISAPALVTLTTKTYLIERKAGCRENRHPVFAEFCALFRSCRPVTVYHESDFYLRKDLIGIRIFSARMLEHRAGHLLTFLQLRQKLRQNAQKSTNAKNNKSPETVVFQGFFDGGA